MGDRELWGKDRQGSRLLTVSPPTPQDGPARSAMPSWTSLSNVSGLWV